MSKKASRKTGKDVEKGISRREFMKKSVVVAGTLAGTGIFGKSPYVFTPAYASTQIRTVGLAVSIIPEIQKKATEDLKMNVIGQALGSEAMVQRQRTQPDLYDVSEGYFYDIDITWQGYQPIDTKRIKDWDQMNPLVTEGYLDPNSDKLRADGVMGDGDAPRRIFYVTENGEITQQKTRWVTMVPTWHNADSLGYNADEITEPVMSWGELFNPEHKGKTAIIDVANIGTQDTALAMQALGLAKFQDMGNMTRKEIDMLVGFLIEKKKEGHFRAFWNTFPQSVQLMTSGEVVIQSMWSPAVTVARARGTNCVYADMEKEGYRGWHGGLAISKEAKGKVLDACYDYINWWISGWAGAFIGRQGYYMHWQDKVKKHMTSEEWDYWYLGKPAATQISSPDGMTIAEPGEVRDGGSYMKRMSNIYSWNSFPDEIDYMVRRWNELKAA